MATLRATLQQVADIIGDGATVRFDGNIGSIVIPNKGRYIFGTQADRCYCFASETTGMVSQGFTVDPWLCDEDDEGHDEAMDEIADDLTHLIEDEAERAFAHFASKAPHNTAWLSLDYNLAHPPQALLDDLKAAGWQADSRFPPASPLNNRQTLQIGSPGSDIFNSWTPAERKQKMAAARKVLRKHGFADVPWRKLGMADLI